MTIEQKYNFVYLLMSLFIGAFAGLFPIKSMFIRIVIGLAINLTIGFVISRL